jgi:hypothetical protein
MAQDWVAADPDRAKQWLARRFSLDPAYVNTLWPDMQLAVRLPQEILEVMDGEARWLARKGDRSASPDFARTLHALPLLSVKPEAVTLFVK